MSIGESLPVVQMGHVEKLAENLQNQPAVQQQVMHNEAERILREQNSKVPPAEESQKGKRRRVNERGEEKPKEGRPDHDRPAPRDGEPEEPGAAPNPWAGNILNLKV